MNEIRAAPRDWVRKCKAGEDGEEGNVIRAAKLSEETNMAATCEVSVCWEICTTILLTINVLIRVENKMHVTYFKLIQTHVGETERLKFKHY